MKILVPETYLISLISLLVIIAILITRQLITVRRDEDKLLRLEKGGASSSKDASQLYELATVQLRKRLYPQATETLKKAIRGINNEPDEAKALIENALGFALAAQDKFEPAILHYQKALKAKSDYPVALNNLAFAKQRLLLNDEAISIYKEVINLDSKNKTALKQLRKLERGQKIESPGANDRRGF